MMYLFCSGITQNVFFSSVSLKDRQSDEATCVAEGGNEW